MILVSDFTHLTLVSGTQSDSHFRDSLTQQLPVKQLIILCSAPVHLPRIAETENSGVLRELPPLHRGCVCCSVQNPDFFDAALCLFQSPLCFLLEE